MDTYPNNVPICYVIPTPETFINVSQYVDDTGKISVPYLDDWDPVSKYFFS